MRAVIYARYSSENQREASIEDQIRLCKERIVREGWTLVQVYRDAATSGASALRPGYQALLQAARDGGFDVLVAEALDRLSRDQEDVAALFKRLRFAGIRIVTLAEGEISELHVGLKGTMNALFLKDLADKTRRGLRGRVATGKSAGGRSFGYDVVREIDAAGRLLRGDRRINPSEAAIVRRIFEMFASGRSPIAIARTLNAEQIPGPQGAAWRDTTIRGHAARRTGILRNELYIGRLVWNRMRFIKDPVTGKRVSRANPPEQWIIEDVPHLRVIDDELWSATQRRLREIRSAAGADRPGRRRFWEQRRAQHVLTGKVFCGCCGRAFGALGRDYLGCTASRRQGICDNRRGIRRGALEALILDALRTRLMAPDLVAEFVASFTAEWNRLQAQAGAEREQTQRELATVQRKLAGLIDAIADGLRAPGLQQQLDQLEGRRLTLEATIVAAPAPAPRLHPNLAEIYRERVARLQDALRDPAHGHAALDVVRGLVERVMVRPAAAGLEIELIGEIAAMIRLGLAGNDPEQARVAAADRDLFARSVKVVAGAGFEPAAFRL